MDEGGPEHAANVVRQRFPQDLEGVRTQLDDLLANFQSPDDQGPRAYADQMVIDYPETPSATHKADAILAIEAFHRTLFASER